MGKKAKKPVDVMITAFRDGFQSVYGARVLTADFLPAFEAALRAGLTHFEVGGGARFQSLYFYCNEDAFEMMDKLREVAGPEANLQTLGRGVNVVGLDSQPSDIIKMHADLFAKHGISTIRNFDALNDVDNLDYSGRCIVEAGLSHEVSVTMMGLPPGLRGEAHTPEFYMQSLQNILDAEIPFDTVCFKDASGTAPPEVVYQTVKLAKKKLPGETTVRFHTHETAGISAACYRAALEAGATAIDCSLAPVSGGTCQPDVVVMWQALRGTEWDLGVDIKKVLEAEEVFKECMKDYENLEEASRVEPLIPFSPMPGGALTANTQMMRDNNILDKFPEVIAAMEDVVARGGFGTSVTPVSQFYFQQAFNNVMMGPWKKVAEGYGKMVLGYFGKTPEKPDPEIVKLSQEQLKLEPTTKSPRLINDEDPAKGVAPAEKMLTDAGLPTTDENIFIAATCKEKGILFLKGEAKVAVRKKQPAAEGAEAAAASAPPAAGAHPAAGAGQAPPKPAGLRSFHVYVNDQYFQVEVGEEGRPTVSGASAPSMPAPPRPQSEPLKAGAAAMPQPLTRPEAAHKVEAGDGETPVLSPMPGVVIRYEKSVGDTVEKGETLVVVEAMKMNNNIEAPCSGEVSRIFFSAGDSVAKENVLCLIKSVS